MLLLRLPCIVRLLLQGRSLPFRSIVVAFHLDFPAKEYPADIAHGLRSAGLPQSRDAGVLLDFWVHRPCANLPAESDNCTAQDFIKLLFLAQWLFHRFTGKWLKIICCRKPKICSQLFSRLPQGQLKQFCGEVDYIPIRSTAKTVKSRVHFHAGIAVCMEWTANHAAAVWTKAIGFCGLPGGDIQLYDFK